jgi:hypothetical protein
MKRGKITGTLASWQLDLVRDAISGLPFQLPRADIMFVPFLDCISLLHQQRVIYALWRGRGRSAFVCCHVFLEDPSYLARFTQGNESPSGGAAKDRLRQYVQSLTASSEQGLGKVLIPLPAPAGRKNDYAISLHTLPTPSEFLDPSHDVMKIAEGPTEQVRQLLNIGDDETLLDETFRTALRRSAAWHAKPASKVDTASRLEKRELSEDTIDLLLAPMKDSLNAILGHVGSTQGSLRIQKNGLPNIFTVVRLHSGPGLRYKQQFDYTCRFIVLEGLQKWLSSAKGRTGSADEVVAILERPLRTDMRSVADHVFSNGTLTFKLDPRERGLNAIDEGSREHNENWMRDIAAIEKKMYPEGTIMYVPIHVCLTPWITLYTVNPRESGRSGSRQWHHNYLFYRELVHGVADQIRSSAANAYLSMFAKCVLHGLRDVYSSADAVARAANREFEDLAQIYPFPLGKLSISGNGSIGALELGNRGVLRLCLHDNPFFSTTISDSGVTLQQVVSYCQSEVHAFLERESRVASRGIADATHLMKFQLKRLLNFVSDGNTDEACAVASKLLLLHEVSEARLNIRKRDALKTGSQTSVVPATDFELVVEKHLFNVLRLLRQLTYSGTLALKIKLLDDGLFATSVTSSITSEQRVTYYDFLIATFMEGLMSNALVNMHIGHPVLKIALRCDGERVLLVVSNSVPPDLDLDDVLLKLNHPGSDGIGVAQLHWLVEAFWVPGCPPRWESEVVEGVSAITATIQVGEMG